MEREKVIADRIERKSDRISQEILSRNSIGFWKWLIGYDSYHMSRTDRIIFMTHTAISLKYTAFIWRTCTWKCEFSSSNVSRKYLNVNFREMALIVAKVTTCGAGEFKYKSFGRWYKTWCPRWNKKNYKNCKFRLKIWEYYILTGS